MSLLLHGDCLEQMKTIDDASVDLIFCDLPYGQISCSWDIIIAWEPFWKEIMRVKKINTPLFFTTTTKFGVELINSAPKKCPFRYDIVFVKSASCGFLSSSRMPMRKHEMIYVFYEKLPFYDLSSHKHKFIKERDVKQKNGAIYGGEGDKKIMEGKYSPPLPVSVVKEVGGATGKEDTNKPDLYGIESGNAGRKKGFHQTSYDPPLPVSVIKEEDKSNMVVPDSDLYGKVPREDSKECGGHQKRYDPPLPVSIIKEETEKIHSKIYETDNRKNPLKQMGSQTGNKGYDPPLPNSVLEIKSTRGKHSTEKPVKLMEWVLKYYSKEGDVVLDPTMGSGSTGVACKNMNRNFIGIEMDDEIYEVACNRIYE